MNREPTKKEIENWNEGKFCPICNKNNVFAISGPQIDGGIVWQLIECQDCNAEWEETYTLAGFEIIE